MATRPTLTPEHRLRDAISTLLRIFLVNERVFPVAGGATRYSPHDFQTLDHLARNPGLRIGALAEFLAVSPTTATSVIDRLVRRGLVSRRMAPDDQRARVLLLTKRGQALSQRILTQDLVNMRALLGTLPPAERAHFTRLMEQVAGGLAAKAG